MLELSGDCFTGGGQISPEAFGFVWWRQGQPPAAAPLRRFHYDRKNQVDDLAEAGLTDRRNVLEKVGIGLVIRAFTQQIEPERDIQLARKRCLGLRPGA